MHSLLLLLQAEAEHGLELGGVALDLLGFLAYFAFFGALGFRLIVLRRDAGFARGGAGEGGTHGAAFAAARRGAATIGMIGAVLFIADVLLNASGAMAARHMSLMAALTGRGGVLLVALVCGVIMLLGFALGRGALAGWILAAIAALTLVFRGFLTTFRWPTLINPVHEMCAALWLGTLLVLVVVGLPAVLRSGATSDERGQMVAHLVGRFSPLALTAAGTLALTGVTTAWRHLKHLDALWTTSYGYALDVKLLFVLIIVSLGAWNWRTMTPRLGTEAAAGELRRSATAELAFGALVLVLTAVLVNLPSPRG
jgi:putative copper export protein